MIGLLILQSVLASPLPVLAQPTTFHVSGRVLSDQGAPVRRAVVTLSGASGGLPISAITDDLGRFDFEELPAGRYRVSAGRAGYVSIDYGAAEPGEPGRLLVIGGPAGRRDIVLTLHRGSVISGTIRDSRGDPVLDAQVTVVRETAQGLLPQAPSLRTDERGRYRAFGLAAGIYLVVARVTTPVVGVLRSPSGMVGAFAPTYYPSEYSSASATRIEVGVGRERDGVDVVIALVPTGEIIGRIVAPFGVERSQATATLRSGDLLGQNAKAASVDTSGQFTFVGLAPGEYILDVQCGPSLFGRVTAVVGGGPVDVVVPLSPGKMIRGTITTNGESITPRVRLSLLRQAAGRTAPFVVSPAHAAVTADAQGGFEFAGVPPGRYKLAVEVSAGSVIDGLTVEGKDALESGFEVLPEAAELRASLRVVTSLAVLSGRVTVVPEGNPEDYVMVLFPVDPALWRAGSQRLLAGRPGADGHFTMPGLLSGRYWLAAVRDFGAAEWQVTGFLERLSVGAVAVVVKPGQVLTQDVRVGGNWLMRAGVFQDELLLFWKPN